MAEPGLRHDVSGRPLDRTIRSRRMVRSFTTNPIDEDVIDDILDLARRAPSAGNIAAVEYLVLDTPETVATYWSTTMSEDRRATFRWQGLFRAPVLVVLVTRPLAYVQRYAETDKARARLGSSTAAWRQPFWWIDAGMVAQNLLLTVNDRGLGACLFGLFDHENEVKATFAVPSDRRLVCTIAIGRPDESDRPGRSAGRPRPDLEAITHRRGWGPPLPPRGND